MGGTDSNGASDGGLRHPEVYILAEWNANRPRSPLYVDETSAGTDRHPSMASRRLNRSSSIVSPCVAQAGMEGASAQKSAFFSFVHNRADLHKESWWRRRESNPRPKKPAVKRTTCVSDS